MPLRSVEASDEWETPAWLFSELNVEFRFTLDAAATESTAKCAKYLTPQDDALSMSWGQGETVWLNPPYGRGIAAWVSKARDEARAGSTVVLLIPARLDTNWWHDVVLPSEVRIRRGRVRFLMNGRELPTAGPFPVAVVVMRPTDPDSQGATWWSIERWVP